MWDEDYAAFDLAGITTVTLGVFAWAHLQPAEDRYDFSRLDAIVERATAEGRSIVLATPSGAMPPWLAQTHPDACRVDFEGRRHVYGQRHNHCPSSTAFARLSVALAGRLARAVRRQPGGRRVARRQRVRRRLLLRASAARRSASGSASGTPRSTGSTTRGTPRSGRTRSPTGTQVQPPTALSEHWRGPNHTAFQGITLDYRRFMSDALLGGFLAEKAAIRAHVPHTPVTTNLMGLYQPIDYHRWAEHLDLATWDNYPPEDPSPIRTAARMALAHGAMRGPARRSAVLGDGADPVDHRQPRRQRR